MFPSVQFHRYDQSSSIEGLSYTSTDKLSDMDHDFKHISMNRTGFTLNVQVQNYTGEAIFLCGSLRTIPTRINSLQTDGFRSFEHYNNFVVMTILTSEDVLHHDPKKRNTHHTKTEIRVPAKLLNRGSVFVKELDCYLTTESQLEATRELIVKDVHHSGWEKITLPQTMMKTDPVTIYGEYKELVEDCILRQDKISIRIGLDLQYDKIPDIIKTMRVAILDSYFIPFRSYKLVYDPTLGPDDFVIENLRHGSMQNFQGKLRDLELHRTIYLDQDKTETLFGEFYGLVILADEKALLNYVYARKSQERFDEETLFIADRTGDPLLREKVIMLEDQIKESGRIIEEQKTALQSVRAENKQLIADLSSRDKTITQLRTGHAAKMSADVVISDIANERSRTQNDRDKIFYDTRDLDHRDRTYPMQQKAQTWKVWGEIVKSGWAIVAAIAGGVLSAFTLYKKYAVS